MSKLRVIIVDDEAPARRKVRRFLADEADVEVVGEAASGRDAVELVRATSPDLVLLDVQMPGLNGFGVLNALGEMGKPLPRVIFLTAYDEYAVKAFEVHAVDYLLKPFDQDRFRTALGRARSALERARAEPDPAGRPRLDEQLRRLLEELGAGRAFLDRILVQKGSKHVFVPVEDIDWIGAAENYVAIHAGAEKYLLRATLGELEQRLDPRRFARVHRSHIVNLDRVRELHPWSHGDFLLVLQDGTRLKLSRRYRDRLPEWRRGS